MPDNPSVLLAAALYLHPGFGSIERRRPFLEKALRLLESDEDGLGPQQSLLRARVYKALEMPDEAIRTYRELLTQDASQMRLRYEFATYLCELHKFDEAHHELRVILAQNPKDGAAKGLLDAVSRGMLREKTLDRKRQRDDFWLRHQQR